MTPPKNFLISALLVLCFGVLRADEFNPYPRISKQFAKGRYQKGLDMIKSSLPNTKNENRLWLYSMQIKGYLKLYEQDNSALNVKRAVQAAKFLNNKSTPPKPEFAQLELDRLRMFFTDYSSRYALHSISAQRVIRECIEPISEIYPDKDMAWHIYGFLLKTEPEQALNILSAAVQKNYDSRINGDTTDFYQGYLPLLNHFASRARFSSFFTIYKMLRNSYPNKASVCSDITGIVQKTGETLGLNQPYTQKILNEIIDTMQQSGCKVLPLQLSLKEAFRYYCEVVPNFKEALNTAMKLAEMSQDSCGSAFFRKTFAQNLSLEFSRADSFRWAIWMKIAGFKNDALMMKGSEALFYEMLNQSMVFPCTGFQKFLNTRFPTEKKTTKKMAEAIAKSKEGQLDKIAASSSGLDGIIDYYHKNSILPETRELTITKLLKLGNDMRGAGNYSMCMRISKQALRLFPSEKRLIEEKIRWMRADFEANYNALSDEFEAEVRDFDPSRCKEGYVTDDYQKKFLRALDVVRRFAGVNDSCQLSPEKNKECQQAALIMDANNRLTHHPSKFLKCFTNEGLSAASTSNLSLGHNGINALFGQLEDWGANNYFVGHRRWILNPHNNCFGHGSTKRSMAFGVINCNCSVRYSVLSKNVFIDSTDFVAWPTTDYFPKKWLPLRWSFGFVGASFEKSKVSVFQSGVSIPVKLNKIENNYATNTLVWEIEQDNWKKDTPIFVKITNVQVGNKTRDFYYQVTLF